MDVVRLSLLLTMWHIGLCNCKGSVTLYSRLDCGELRAYGVGQLHHPVPTPITRPVPNHTESRCTVICGCIQPTGCSVHYILLSRDGYYPCGSADPVLFTQSLFPLKIMSPCRILFSSSYGCDSLVCRNLELVFGITGLAQVAGFLAQRDRPFAGPLETDTRVHTALRREGYEPTIPLCEPQYTS